MGHESCPFPDRDCYDCSFLWLDGCVLHITEGENIFGMAYNNTDNDSIYSHIYFGSKKGKNKRTRLNNKRTASKTEAE